MTSMIKGIIQKIIMSTFGKFIKGIEKDKLSIDLFSGNFQLENISFNHSFFDNLNTPFTLVYSAIGKLSLQAPISKLSSAPVDCLLENIYAVVQFKETEGDNLKCFSARKTIILKQVQEVLQSTLKRIKQEKKQDGMMAKLGKKIIDNLQMKIKNVHLRFEQKDNPKGYAFGLTLEEISFTTTDQQWKPTFIQRKTQSQEKLFKMMQVKKLNLYWQSGSDQNSKMVMCNSLDDQERKERLNAMIHSDIQVVISITSQFKLIINPPEDTQSAIYQLEIALQPLKFQLKRLQLQQMMNFARKNVMENENIVKSLSKKSKTKIPQQQKGRLREQYQHLIGLYLYNYEENTQLNTDLGQHQASLEEIFVKIDENELKIWAMGPIKKKVKLIREIQIKKKKGGWFNRGNTELTEQEQQQLKIFIDQSFENEKCIRQAHCLLFRIKAQLKGGKMQLIENKATDIEEIIEFNIGKISTQIEKSEDKSYFNSYLEIQSINLNLYLSVQKDNQSKKRKMEIFTSEKPTEYKEQSDEDSMQSFDSAQEDSRPSFLKLRYTTQLFKEKALIKKTIDGNIERLTVIYKKVYMQKFRNFFRFKDRHSFVKNNMELNRGNLQQNLQSLDKGEQLDEQQFKLQKHLDVKLNVNSPVFICPLNEKECWCLNLGRLKIKSNRNDDCQEYPMTIQSAFLRYYPFMKECFDLNKKKQGKGIFSLISDMDFSVNYQIFKKINEEILNIQLPSFKVNFTQSQYQNLMSLRKVFEVQQQQKRSMVQMLKEERKAIDENRTYESPILKKHQTLMSWREFHGIISGEYLYLYNNRQQLKENSKIHLKNAKIMLKSSQVDMDQDNYEIQLTNQNEICYLSCHETTQMLKWKIQLENKCSSFKTIHQMMKDYDEIENRSAKKRGGSQTLNLQGDSKRKILKFKVIQVDFKYENEHQDTLLEFQIIGVNFSRQNMQSWSEKQFSMQKLKITDRIFKFKNPCYQTLIEAKDLTFQELKGKKNKLGNREAIMNINIKDLYINWKPDVLLILIRLASQHFKAQENYRLDDDIQQSRQEHFKQSYSDSKFMFFKNSYDQKGKGIQVKQKRDQLSLKANWMKQIMKITITFNKFQINLIHRETHLVMIKLISNDINCSFCITDTAKFVSGYVNELDIYDMTGYPQKEYSTNEQLPPYRILTKKASNASHLIQYRWSSYDPSSFPNEQHVDSFFWVEITPLEYQYYQQVTFRMIDYFLIQIILLLTQPEMLTVNENLMQQLKNEQVTKTEKPVRILFSRYDQIIKKLIHPFFMDMYFKVKDITLILKAEKSSHIYYETVIKDLQFYNCIKKAHKRFKQADQKLKELIFEQEYIIKGDECYFRQMCRRKGTTQQLFEPFKLEVIFNKLIFQDQINSLYPQVEDYDRSFLTTNNISNIIISHYSRLQYLNINKLVNFNFTFDDQHDEMFIHNFKITKILSPKPILYDLIIPELHMTADYNAKEQSDEIWKLFKATIHRFRFIFRRNKQLNSSMEITMGLTEFTGFEYEQNKAEPNQIYLMTLGQFQKNSTQIIIENKTSGQKLIQMSVNELQINVRTGLLQLILQYTLIEDWVFPNVNKVTPELIFHANIHKMNASLNEDHKLIVEELKKKKVSIKIINSILSQKIDLTSFKLQGLVCYKFYRKKDLTIQEYEKKLAKGQMKFQDFERKQEEMSSMSLIMNTQIYRGWTNGQSKRKIIDRFSFHMQDKRFLRVADLHKHTIKTIAKRTMNIDRCFMKISFKDVILMKKILNQITEERKYIHYLNEKTGKVINQHNNQKETELSSLQNLQLNVQTVSFYLINSRRDIFIPILKINLANINLTKTLTYKKDILKSQFSIALYYFNNKILKWQPILETVNLSFHKILYFSQNNVVFGSFESREGVLINLSRQVFMSLKQTVDSWKKQSEEQDNKYIIKEIEVEPLQFISHYIIRNEIGYPVEILNNKLQLIKKISHNEQMDYQLQVSNYNEEVDQLEIFIGFRIIHPKYPFSEIANISFNSQKEYNFVPKIKSSQQKVTLSPHSQINIKPQIVNGKKVLMIKSCKYIYNYLDGHCQIKALPFDHDTYFILPKTIHNELKVSLYEEKSTDHYRYIGKNGVLKIMKKDLVYNYSPIPLQICGKIIQPNQYMGISQSLRLQGKSHRDSIMKVVKNEKAREYYIFSQCYLIDYYGLAFEFQKDNKEIQKLYCNKFYNHNESAYFIYILSDPEFKFKVKIKDHPKCSSVSLKTTIGKSNFILEDDNKAECHFTIYSYLTPLENVHINQFIRVIEITPKYMLSNATKTLVKICQVQSCDSITLNPYERVPFFWQNRQKAKFIKLSSYDGIDFWGYSGELSIQKSTQTIVLRKSSDPKLYKIFTLQMQVTNTVTFLHIIEPSPKYMLSNKIPGTIMQVYQKAILDDKLDLQYSFPVQFFFNVKHNEEKPFGYELPEQSRILNVKIGFQPYNMEYNGLSCDPIDIDQIETNLWVKKIAIRDQQKNILQYFYLSLKFENNIKKLMITRQIEEQQMQNSYEFIVKVPSLGLSLVGFHKQIRKQIIHIMFNDIQVQFFGNSDSDDIDLRIGNCRIENQLKYNAIFPVIFQSLKNESLQKKFVHFKVSRSSKNSRLIHYIGCSINRSQLTITSEQIQAIQEYISEISLYDVQTNQVAIRKCQMFNSTLPDPEESIYFVQAVIYPLKVVVTFKHVNQWGGKLLKTLSSLHQCPISAEGQQLRHFTCLNFSMFFNLLLKHYQDGLAKMVLSMIGNLTILGSPVTLVQKIGSGFKDLVELPVNQFQNGPLQVGKGALKGTASLVSNTISGAFNTVESITGSIGNGISVLVDGDRQFVRDRENIKNEKSEHIFEGLANGAKSIAYGFKNGLAGVINQPAKGAKKYGLPGFLLGTAKGLGGLILKPISGVIDAASKTAEGIKNTPEFFSSQKKQKSIRLHNPRPFYNYNKQFRNYDKHFADLIKIIYEQDRQKYDNLSWCSYYRLVNKTEKSIAILLLSYEYIFFYDIRKNKMLNTIDSATLTGVSLKEEQGQSIIKMSVIDKKLKREGTISINPDGGCRKLASQLGTIIRHYSPNFKFA